jgi:uncharacterized repeat protein (TIGR01451 family)
MMQGNAWWFVHQGAWTLQEVNEMRWLSAPSRGAVLLAVVLLTAALVGSPAYSQGTGAGTVIQNSANLDYNNSGGQAQPTVTSNTASVTVTQIASMQVAPATGASTGQAAQVIYYAVTVTNKGNGADTFALTASSASTPAWTVTIYKDDGAGGGTANDGIHQAGETNVASSTGSLAAEATFKCFAAVAVPGTAANGTVDQTTFTATSGFDGTKKATAAFSTTVTGAVMSLTKSVDKSQAAPGDSIRYTITYSNTGDASATSVVIRDTVPAAVNYTANSVKVNGASKTDAADGDNVTVASGVITINIGTVAAGASGTITFDATVK